MTSKNSFSKGGLLQGSLRRDLWGFVLSGLGFFLTLLLPVLMLMQRTLQNQKLYAVDGWTAADLDIEWESAVRQLGRWLGGGNVMVKLMLLALAVVCGVSAFSYLHSRRKVDFYHSLPVSRTRLFASQFGTGLLCVAPLYLIFVVLTVLCAYAMGFGEAVQWGYILQSAINNLILFWATYALSALAAILCGNTVISLLLLVWFLAAGPSTVLLKSGLMDQFYERYLEYGTIDWAIRLSPVSTLLATDGGSFFQSTAAGDIMAEGSALRVVLAYLIVAVAVTALSLWLFRIRKSERAGSALAFSPLKLPVKVFMCLFIGTLVGIVLKLISGGEVWFWFGLVLGVFVFHCVVEIIYAFDFHAILAKPVQMAAILVVLVAGMLCMKLDVTGFNDWFPAAEQVAAVSIDDVASVRNGTMLQTPENIALACSLAERGVQWQPDDGETQTYALEMYFRMNGGSVKTRRYWLPYDEQTRELLQQINSSEENVQLHWPLFSMLLPEDGDEVFMNFYTQTGDIDSALMQTGGSEGVYAGTSVAMPVLRDVAKARTIMEALREETLARPADAVPVMRLEMEIQSGRNWNGYGYLNSFYVTAQDTRTLALIREYTGIEPTALTDLTVGENTYIEIEYPATEENSYAVTTVTDPLVFAQLLQNAINTDQMDLYNNFSMSSGTSVLLEETDARVNLIADGRYWSLRYPAGKAPLALIESLRADAVQTEYGLG